MPVDKRPTSAETEPRLKVGNIRHLLNDRFDAHHGVTSLPKMLDDYILERTTGSPLLKAAPKIASRVIILGTAGFRPMWGNTNDLASSDAIRRRSVLDAVEDDVTDGLLLGINGRPANVASSVANYYVISGKLLLTDDNVNIVGKDLLEDMQESLKIVHRTSGSEAHARLGILGMKAADYRLITGEVEWSEHQNVEMAQAALELGEQRWGRDLTVEGASLTEATMGIAAARVLMAQNIIPVADDPNRGVMLEFPPGV